DAIPPARFAVVRAGRWTRRFEPAVFQARVPGTTLWDMFDFQSVEVMPRWRAYLPAISAQLSSLLDSTLVDLIDWNIQNFVFAEPERRLFYVDLNPSTFVVRHSNEQNLTGIRDYFLE